MGRFNLFISNRMERLAAQLADTLRRPLSDPLWGDIIIVQNRGMERWISMQLALRHGICANVRFPFPRVFLHEIATSLTGISPAGDYEPEILTWRIMGILPGCLNAPLYSGLKRYLTDDPADLKRVQLAAGIARVFDRYLIFRPEMVDAWEKGESGTGEAGWQADLWRRIRATCTTEHLNGLRKQIRRRIATGSSAALLPERISIFGISVLPPFYLDFFHLLSQSTEVNGFFMNPCREFWTDIRSEREMGRMVQRVREKTGWKTATEEDLFLEKGNGLLASLGKQGRDFFSRLAAVSSDIHEEFPDPGEGSLLTMVQADMLNLRDRGGGGIPKAGVARDDRSVQIHSCHGPLREIEILHDQLLEMFSQNADILPNDIIVMAPDIEIYAPLVEAVFGGDALRQGVPKRRREIPFSIADRGIRHGSAMVRAVFAILELVTGRFGVAGSLSILDSAPVRRRFGLEDGDVDKIRRWIAESGIRWGIDPEDRARSGLPAFRENTWRSGLDRLLLGYAMAGDGRRIFRGVVPYDDIEGKDAEILGRFITYAEALFSLRASLAKPRSLGDWAAAFLGLLEAFFAPAAAEDEEEELRSLRRSLEEIGRIEEKAAFHDAVAFSVMKSLLTNALDNTGHPYGYMTGGVTFCAMVPMRSIPARVVCLLGMNNADYPRRSEPVDFDLLSENPRSGDPSRRDDDRYLFLEALLSARDTLYISYVGQSSEDNSVIPPSVLVSELIDHLGQGYRCEGETVEEHLLTRHHLHPFHPSYFSGDAKLFSYSAENCAAAGSLVDPSRAERKFATELLPEPETGWREISTADLITFFRNPSKYLMKRRIGLSLDEGPEILREKELFRIGGMERYRLGESLLEHALGGGDPREPFQAMMASGELPHGAAGLCEYDALCRKVTDFAASAAPLLKGRRTSPLDVDLTLAGFHISGRIDGLCEAGLIRRRYATIRGKDHLRLWIDLLLWSLAEPAADHGSAVLLGREEAWGYTVPENPREALGNLLRIYAAGLRGPAPFFPETSLAYAETLHGGKKTAEAALKRAESSWNGNEQLQLPGEGDDPYFRLCFGADPPLDPDFREMAVAVFEPLLSRREKRGR
ncbi:MAG: exodeoxyribonuclease V subunit gamma [Syntrophaceae bacterium CG2_30_58_14]|nr:MAG: exodeoxyribonuclease V subunit gamma [Syntrophaceae bacterium CG2_30_58_14]